MQSTVVIDIFSYQDFYSITGRGLVVTGMVNGNASKVRPGMSLNIRGEHFTIVGVARFNPLIPTRPIGLMLNGLTQKYVDSFSEGEEFAILERSTIL